MTSCDRCSKPAVVLLAISRDDPTGLKRIETRTRRCSLHRDDGIQRRDRVRTIKSFHHYDTDQSGVRGA